MRLHFRVHKNIDHVYAYLTDMQKFVSVHPVISRMEATSENGFRVFETLKLGFLPFSFTYPVTVTANTSEKTIVIRATVFKLTHIEMHFRLRADNAHTVIDEEIQFRSPLPVVFIMKRVFREQHEKLFRNIETS